mgnify:CR=1 FL=1
MGVEVGVEESDFVGVAFIFKFYRKFVVNIVEKLAEDGAINITNFVGVDERGVLEGFGDSFFDVINFFEVLVDEEGESEVGEYEVVGEEVDGEVVEFVEEVGAVDFGHECEGGFFIFVEEVFLEVGE